MRGVGRHSVLNSRLLGDSSQDAGRRVSRVRYRRDELREMRRQARPDLGLRARLTMTANRASEHVSVQEVVAVEVVAADTGLTKREGGRRGVPEA